jgi:hypothetical protein
MVYTDTILQLIHYNIWLLLLVLITITIESSESIWAKGSFIAVLANLRCCLTSINVRMVFGFKLARHREMVSRSPEKIHSTATAEPRATNQYCTIVSNRKYIKVDWLQSGLQTSRTGFTHELDPMFRFRFMYMPELNLHWGRGSAPCTNQNLRFESKP